MKGADSTAPLALGLAAALGLLADGLFPAGPEGAGFALWILFLGVAAVTVARRVDPASAGAVGGWSAVSTAAAAALLLRDTPVVIPAMWLVMLASASMVLLRAGGVRLWTTRPVDHVVGFAAVPARAALGTIALAVDAQPPPDSSRRRIAAVLRGVVLAVPLLLLFGALFAAADAGFERYVERFAALWLEDLLAHLAVIFGFGWIAAGLLSGVRAKRLPNPFTGFTPPRLGSGETAVVLGSLAALFLTFVGFQLGYLFGGREVIEVTSGLTVADYARRGFFELMVVGLATVGVLLVGDALSSARRLFRWLAAVLIGCALVILASAVQRLMLYTNAFGLTVDRITAAVVMAWVAAVLVLFAVTVLRDRPGRFSSAAVLAGIAAVFVLALINPGAMAARSNLDRAMAGAREADVAFLSHLSADAVPAILQRVDELPPAAQCELGRSLLDRWGDAPYGGHDDRDWRGWNAARSAARRAVQVSEARLTAAAHDC
ncbi:MAG: DUF4173 domain-containing protein [Gemmatimonadota bacterium]